MFLKLAGKMTYFFTDQVISLMASNKNIGLAITPRTDVDPDIYFYLMRDDLPPDLHYLVDSDWIN